MPKAFSDRTDEIFSSDDSIKTFIDRKVVFTKNDKDYICRKDIFEQSRLF